MTSSLLVLNGPNLNTLGLRQPEIYGHDTLADVEARARAAADAVGLTADCRQTNHEGEAIDWLHAARGQVAGIVINPGGWTHTSVALADALVIPEVPIIEVHLSNVYARESFRHVSYVSPIAAAVISGCGIDGYEFAVRRLARLIA
ncbi:type II 3-dehydroquinate dehydratase [Jongsikchunia kroppenstedtii]|uniref:type II 3-dehydroquinate dehydratase n=1 Tax=Jongsikchunia kroppenstedtii TaxID=1121721 RepID=UPI00038199AD|nr:type II 3-dehydroquinate dehydratase [Jongsikchunia kroppenstedtii]